VRYVDPDGRKETDIAMKFVTEAVEVIKSHPEIVPPLVAVIKLLPVVAIVAFSLCVQGDTAQPSLPPNYSYKNGIIIAPNGTAIATVEQAYKHYEGLPDWHIVTGWSEGSRDSSNDSLLWHFEKHGAEVGARTPKEYLLKALDFAKDLKRVRPYHVSGYTPNVQRYEKKGKYIDIDETNKKIVSFGRIDHVD